MTSLRKRTNSEREIETTSVRFDHSNFYKDSTQILPVTEMACRDRTVEFISVVKNKESASRLKDNGYLREMTVKKQKLKEWTNFMDIAKNISRDIHQTFMKLEKLTLLAKKRSLFDDNQCEIQELTYIVKSDINHLNKQIAELQQMSKSRVPSGKHMQSHTNSVVVSLQSKLALMSNDFKEVLEVRTENLKQQKSRREKFTDAPSALSVGLPPTSGNVASMLISEGNDHSNGEVAINMDNYGGNQFQHQMQLINQQDSYIEERADAMLNIQATIVELGSIFEQLAHMVKEHEEIVQRIDSNVEDVHLNVEAAHSEILKYFQSVTSNRWLMIKVFAILIVFFIIFVVFVA